MVRAATLRWRELLAVTSLGAILGAVISGMSADIADDLARSTLTQTSVAIRHPMNLGAIIALGAGVVLTLAGAAVQRLTGWKPGIGLLRRIGPALGAVALPTLVGVNIAYGTVTSRRPNVVLIVVDTLRADHLGSYGYERQTSPRLDELASGSLWYRNAVSTAPWTTPAVGAMLSGKYPAQLGVTDQPITMPESVEQLPELMRAGGYATAGFVSHFFIGRKFGFHWGFTTWDQEEGRGHTHVSSAAISDKGIRFLNERSDAPFFLFLHYFDPHYDYLQHEDYDFTGDYAGPIRSEHDNIHDLRRLAEQGALSAEDIAYLRASYDSEIRFVDENIGRVLAELERLKIYDETLIVFTADHGESFVERPDGWLGHTTHVYQELLHVPLMIKLPGQKAGEQVDDWVSTVSVTPTILDLTGIDVPPGLTFEGAPLTRHLSGRAVFAETHRSAKKQTVVLNGKKLIQNNISGRTELYDLVTDPGERHNLVRDESEAAEALGSLLHQWAARMSADEANSQSDSADLTNAEIDMLRGLGYVR